MAYREYNFDGLVGPTHNYAGLGTGNLASMASKHHVSSPKRAALEGLAKMKLLAELGVPQAVLPPQRRPHVGYLRLRYGATGRPRATSRGEAETRAHTARTTEDSGTGLPSAAPWHEAAINAPIDWIADRPKVDEVAALLRAAAENGEEGLRDLAIASSASAMWAANAATVSPSPDTADGRLHITPANLVSQPHRALEASERSLILRHILADSARFIVHDPLAHHLSDEGAANHTRLCRDFGAPALEIFTYGRSSDENLDDRRFVPRQLEDATLALADLHKPREHAHLLLVKQHPAAVDAGVFHNDVICVGNGNVLLVHEMAWDESWNWPDIFCNLFPGAVGGEVHCVTLGMEELPLADAVRSYLFNSQLVTLPDGSGGGMALIYPAECDEVPTAKAAIARILREDNPVERAVRVDVRQSMKNGGGPACLRLRVVLSDEERAAVRGNVFWTPQLHETLVAWVNRHYRDTLTPQDLAEVRLYEESTAALDELAEILQLPI